MRPAVKLPPIPSLVLGTVLAELVSVGAVLTASLLVRLSFLDSALKVGNRIDSP